MGSEADVLILTDVDTKDSDHIRICIKWEFFDLDQNIESFNLILDEARHRVFCDLSAASSVHKVPNRHQVVEIPAVISVDI